MTPDELWEKYSYELAHDFNRRMSKDKFLAALQEYGESVRQRAVRVCEEISGNEPSGHGGRFGALDCAAAIEKMELP